jgi:hypothetical protein
VRLDPIPFMVARVKATPGLPVGVVVSGDLDYHSPGTRQIDVVLEGGKRHIRDRMDLWHFTLNHYAATKQQAMETALLVREYLLEQVSGNAYGAVSVDAVIEDQGPHDLGDEDSREQRFIHRLSIYIYET